MEKNQMLGIISLYYHNTNCGGLLQAFALCEVLELMGLYAEQVCIDENTFKVIPPEKLVAKLVRKIKTEGFHPLFKYARNKINNIRHCKDFNYHLDAFSNFEKNIFHSFNIYSSQNITDLIEKYDAFITGSDQVWSWALKYIDEKYVDNTQEYNQLLDIYFLRFVPDDKLKIAYAPSIACPYIPDNLKQYYYDSINRLDAVSIREKSSLDLFTDDLRKKITPVCDPTLLLNGEQWCKSLNLNEKKSGQYIFLYLLNPSKSDRKIVKRLSKITGLKVITSPNITMSPTSYDYHLADIDDFNMGPKEFVNYIKDASLVLTNSFHAAVFSIQFHTPFYVIKRESKVSMSSRLDSLLDDYELKGRQISETFDEADVSGYDSIDWDRVDSILNKNREFSIQWLKNALAGVEK